MNPHPPLESFLNWLLHHSIQASVLVLLVLMVQWVFRRQLTSRWRFALWWVVLLRLLLPVNLESAVSLFNFFQPSIFLPGPRDGTAASQLQVSVAIAEPAVVPSDRLEPSSPPRPENNLVPTPARAPSIGSSPMVNTEPAVASRQPHTPRVEFEALLILGLVGIWAAGVLILSLGVGFQLFHFRKQLARSAMAAPADLRELLDECRRVFGVTRHIELLETNTVSSPALFGLLRVRLLLPVGLAGKFSRRELRYIFLHEMAHVRRGDLWLNWLVTSLQLLHWFNPLVWFGFARLRADRELACDELALLRSGETAGARYGETIIKLLAGLGRPAVRPGLVGILEDQKQMRRRIAMIARFKKPGRWSALAVVLLLGLAATALTDAQTQTSPTKGTDAPTSGVVVASTNPVAEAPRPDLLGEIHGADGSPLAATVFLATAAPKTGTSTFCPSCYADCRKSAKTDTAGNFQIKSLDPQLTFQVLVVAKGYQPKFVSKVDPSKGSLKIELEKAERTAAAPDHSIRGRVVDPKGTPIEGAVVEMEGLRTRAGGGSWGALPNVDPLAVTDEQGEFLLTARDPFELMDVKVNARLFANRNFQNLASGPQPHELVLTEGATLTGRVLNHGQPLKSVSLGVSAVDRSAGNYLGNFEIGTDAEGRFAFVNLPPDTDYEIYGIMNTLKPFGAISAQRVRSAKDGDTTDIGDLTVRPAYRLAGQVVLADGAAISTETRLLVSRQGAWDSMQLTLDADGRFDSPGIPAEAISLSVRVKGYRVSSQNPSLDTLNPFQLVGRMDRDITNLVFLLEKGPNLEPDYNSQRPESDWPQNRPLRGAETPPDHSREWTITGRVLDRETREPVPNFRITSGQADSFDRTSWDTAHARTGSNGVYLTYVSKRVNRPLLLAEAEGYLPLSATVLPRDASNVDFLLTKGSGPSGTVVLPDGTPVVGGSVALLGTGNNRIGLDPKGELSAYWNKELLGKTDTRGKFAFAPQWGTESVVATSSNGFALVSLAALATNPVVTLARFGNISGSLTRTSGLGTNEDLDLSFASGPLSGSAGLNLNLHAVTDDQGRFHFDRVPPGKFQITYRQITQRKPVTGWQNQHLQEVEVNPGQALVVDIKTTDRPATEIQEFARPPQPKRIPESELQGVILRPNGQPAADAEVALQVEGKYLAVGKGTFSASNLRTEGLLVNAAADGSFKLPLYERARAVLALNEEGFAKVTLEELKASPKITLQKWGRIEGTLHIGQRLGTNESILISSPNGADPLLYDYNAYLTRTDERGRFVITFVPPGEIQVVRLVPVGEVRQHRPLGTVDVKPGETIVVNFGGDGRTVIGTLKFSDTNAPVNLKAARITLHTGRAAMMERMKQLKTPEERKVFLESEAGKAINRQYRNYPGTIGPDGSFLVEDVPAGEYELSLQLETPAQRQPGHSPFDGVLYNSTHPIVIASAPAPVAGPLDCGDIELKRFSLPAANP